MYVEKSLKEVRIKLKLGTNYADLKQRSKQITLLVPCVFAPLRLRNCITVWKSLKIKFRLQKTLSWVETGWCCLPVLVPRRAMIFAWRQAEQ